MEWYYADGETREGPVSAERVGELFRSGTIVESTLVWRKGMADWLPYRTCAAEIMSAAAGSSNLPDLGLNEEESDNARCAVSGQVMPKSEMLQYGDQWVAPEHKAAFVQKLQEGGPAESERPAVSPDELFADLGFVSIIQQSVKIWTVNLVPILVVTASIWLPLHLILEYLAYHVVSTAPNQAEGIFANLGRSTRFDQIAEFWIGSIAAGSTYWIAQHTWNGGAKVSIAQAFSRGFQNWGRILLTRFLFGLFILLIIIPGALFFFSGETIGYVLGGTIIGISVLIFYVRHGFAEAAAVAEERGGNEALSQSRAVTKGHFWRIIGYQFVIMGGLSVVSLGLSLLTSVPVLNNFICSALLSTAINLVMTFALVELLVFYRHLRDNQGGAASPAAVRP
ncbi:MAG: DUF4339 domain-containing protein [Verrucomicrobiae bacterium]|nr:DUF4339 domain-containing protein [Verrucomicrobiae bacterium]